MTLANRITVLRIALIPVFVILFLQSSENPILKNWTLAVFAFAIFTDLLDGLAARIRKERTPLGTFLDPVADKLLITASFILLTYRGDIPLWVFVVVFSKDLITVMGWTIVYILTSSSKIEPRPLGKATTFLQMAACIALLFPVPPMATIWVVRCMVVVTALSALDYMWVGSQRLEPIPK
jgi:CDP-diacylglycerol--glycerol-3-phosphate 3-phosphatidyltransferase